MINFKTSFEVRYLQRGVYGRHPVGPSPDFIISRDSVLQSVLTRDLAFNMLRNRLSDPRCTGRNGNPRPNAISFVDRDGREVLAISAADLPSE